MLDIVEGSEKTICSFIPTLYEAWVSIHCFYFPSKFLWNHQGSKYQIDVPTILTQCHFLDWWFRVQQFVSQMNRHLASLFGNMRPRWDLSMAFDPEFYLGTIHPELGEQLWSLPYFTWCMYSKYWASLGSPSIICQDQCLGWKLHQQWEGGANSDYPVIFGGAIWSKGWFIFSDPKWGAKVRVAESTKSQGRWCFLCWEGCDCGHCHDTGSEVLGEVI